MSPVAHKLSVQRCTYHPNRPEVASIHTMMIIMMSSIGRMSQSDAVQESARKTISAVGFIRLL
jgi:hypothetical protein